jgi:hypothetical protein
MKRILFILFIIAGILPVAAQSGSSVSQECSAKYKSAEDAFQAGHFTICIEMVEEMLETCDFSRKQKERALQMLAKAYVESGETGKAESTVNILLRNFPHYELKEAENPELFNRMVKKYEIHPKFIFGVKNTGLRVVHHTLKTYSVLDGLDYSQPVNEQYIYFFNYYGCAEYQFTKSLSLNIDGSTYLSEYSRYISPDQNFELIFFEYDRYIVLPLYIKKYFSPGRNFLLYASAGFGPIINNYAKGNVSLEYTTENTVIETDTDFDSTYYNFDISPLRKGLIWHWNAGAGIGYSLRNLRFFVDVRYMGGIGSFSTPEKSDLIPVLKDRFYYIDQEMRLDQFEVGITLSYTLFNSVKRIRK